MKRTSNKRTKVSAARVAASKTVSQLGARDLRPHYDFDYSKSKPNRFAERLRKDAVVVVLEPDVANVFRSSDAVNEFLRSAIAAMPKSAANVKKRTRKTPASGGG
jgi:hypothetical protein